MPSLLSRIDYAITLFQAAEYEEAKILFGRLFKLYKKENHIENMRLCLYHLACIAYIQGERQNFYELSSLYQACILNKEDVLQDIEYYMLRGLEGLSFHHYGEAIHAFSYAIALAEKRRLTEHKILSLLYIQKCHLLLGHTELTLKISNELWTTYQEEIQSDTVQFFYYHLNRADTLYALAHLEEMSELLKACETHKDLQAVPQVYAKTLVTRAKFHMAKKKNRLALSALKKAVEIAESREDPILQSEVYELLIENYERRGKPKKALHYAKKRLALHTKTMKVL